MSLVMLIGLGSTAFAKDVCQGNFQEDPVETVRCYEAVMLRKINFKGPLFKNLEGRYYYGRIEETIQFDKEADFDDKTSRNYVVCELADKYTLESNSMGKHAVEAASVNPLEYAIVGISRANDKASHPNDREVKRQCYFPNNPAKQNKIDENRWGNGGSFKLKRYEDVDKWYIVLLQ